MEITRTVFVDMVYDPAEERAVERVIKNYLRRGYSREADYDSVDGKWGTQLMQTKLQRKRRVRP